MYQLQGNGAYANIYRFSDDQDSDYPVKVAKRNTSAGYDYWSLLSEYDVLQVVNGSPYIIRMLGCVHHQQLQLPQSQPQLQVQSQSQVQSNQPQPPVPDDSFNLVFEAADMNLAQWVARYEGLYCKIRFDHIKRIMLDVALGLNQLHYSGIIHRDLKVCNVVIFRQCSTCTTESCANCRYRAKIIDFGLSVFESPINIPNVSIPLYRAPECYVGKRYNSKIDIWAYGVCLQTILIGNYDPMLPATELNDKLMEILVSNCIDDSAEPVIESLFGARYSNIYKRNNRLNLLNILYKAYGHEVPIADIEQLVDLVTGCMRFDPAKRFSIHDVYNHPWFQQLNEDVVVRPIRREELPLVIRDDTIRKRVMTLARFFLARIVSREETRYSHREFVHGLQLFDRVHTYMVDNKLESPSTCASIMALQHASRMGLVLSMCIYISFKHFTTDPVGIKFKSFFNSTADEEALARLEFNIITIYLDCKIYHPSIYELSMGDKVKINSGLNLIMDGSSVNNLKPSQILELGSLH